MPAWIRASLERPKAFIRAHRVEFSTALFQHSTHGQSTGPEHHAPGEQRFPPERGRHALRRETETRTLADLRLPVSGPASRSAFRNIGAEPEVSIPTPRESGERASHPPATSPPTEPLDTIVTLADLTARVGQHFPDDPGKPGDAATLSARLHALCSTGHPTGAADDAHAATRGALLAHALAQAGVATSEAAHLALERVGMLDFAAPQRRLSQSGAEREAWRIARVLARSGEGRAILAALRAATLNPYRDDLHRMGVETLLTSAEALEPVGASDPAPGAVAAHMGGSGLAPPGAKAPGAPDATPLAARAFEAASALLDRGPDALTSDQRGTLFAWRQGNDEDGRHTVFSQTRTRLARFCSKTIARVAERRWKTVLPRMFRGKHGSPLTALRLGTQGVPRKTIAAERAKVRQHLRAALPQLMQSPAMNPRAALTHARPERSLVELAALSVWLTRGGFAPGPLDPATLREIAERAHALCEEATLPQRGAAAARQAEAPRRVRASVRAASARWLAMAPEELAKTQPFRTIAKRPFTVERLAAWGKVAGLPHDAPFWTTVDALRTAVRHEAPARATNSVDDARETLLDVACNLQSGQRLRLTDGGRQGISTRGLNATLRTLLHGHAVLVSPRIDLRATRTREAVVDISRSTHGVALFVGTARSSTHNVGAGLFAGYDIATSLATVRAGAAANVVLDARELSAPRGVTLRVARRVLPDGSGYDDEAMRAKLADVVGHLFDEASGAHGDGADGVWNRLAERYWQDPDISISWTDGHAANRRRGVTLDANATVKLASFGGDAGAQPLSGEHAEPVSVRAGPSFGGGWERSRQRSDTLDHSGRMQIEEHRVGVGSQWLLRAGIAPGFSHPLDAQGQRTLGLFSIDAPAATLGLRERNRSAKLQLVREDGRLSHRGCILDIEYLDARSYTRALDDSRDELIALFATASTAQALPPGGGGMAGRPREPSAQARAGQRIDAHLAMVRANQRPNLTYVQRYRLRRAAALRIDANEAALAQAGGDPALKARVEAANAKILDDPASWMIVELKVKERTAGARSFGPNFIVQFTTRTGAVGDREIVTESVPFGVLEALDG